MAQQLDDKRPVFDHSATPNVGRMPAWIRQRLGGEDHYGQTAAAVRRNALNTVCEEARCPNRAECWSRGPATFMLLGDTCTRACGFCAVKTGKPDWFDGDEPRRVAEAVLGMNLNYVVLTSVNRDDLPDGGARIFADTLRELVRRKPDLGIEFLTPDFRGCQAAAVTLIHAALRAAGTRLVWGPQRRDRTASLQDRAQGVGLFAVFAVAGAGGAARRRGGEVGADAGPGRDPRRGAGGAARSQRGRRAAGVAGPISAPEPLSSGCAVIRDAGAVRLVRGCGARHGVQVGEGGRTGALLVSRGRAAVTK